MKNTVLSVFGGMPKGHPNVLGVPYFEKHPAYIYIYIYIYNNIYIYVLSWGRTWEIQHMSNVPQKPGLIDFRLFVQKHVVGKYIRQKSHSGNPALSADWFARRLAMATLDLTIPRNSFQVSWLFRGALIDAIEITIP